MTGGRALRRFTRLITHNWPLKLAAVGLAALLYVGLVASQDSATFPGAVPVAPVNQPPDTVITNELHDVEQIRYLAPADLGRLRASDFLATVDLAGVKADGNPASVRVNVSALDPRVTILEVVPARIQVVLDVSASKLVKVDVVTSTPSPGLQLGDVVVDPAEVLVSGASAAVSRVSSVRVNVPLDASGLDVDRDFRPEPLDAVGQVVSGVDLEPASVHVTIPVYTNKESKSLPVNPIVTGTPGAGFRVSAVTVEPPVVSVEGDGDQLSNLASADTAPVPVSGATRDITADVALALPSGVSVIGGSTVRVVVTITPVTETRTFVAGIRLDGQQPDLVYQASVLTVELTLFGSTADLDTLASAPIVISVNVASLGPGTHEVAVVPSLTSGVTVAAVTPPTITVTVSPRPSPSPDPTAAPEPTPTPSPTPAPAP